MPRSRAKSPPRLTRDAERLIALALHMRHDELAYRVDDLRFPLRLAFVLCIAVSFVRLQCYDCQILHPFIMKHFSMFPSFPI